MKRSTLKSLLVASMALVSSAAFAQAYHPISFPAAAAGGKSNFYGDYVGLRFEVTAPAAIAGDKLHTDASTGTGATGDWGGFVTTPLVNVPVVMGPSADTNGCVALATGSMTGKIALIYRGVCEFGFKALQAQNAGAVACVIVNNIPGGPVGMAAGASGATVTIPVFMISNTDGLAISAQLDASVPVTMTITPWGFGNANDLGFVSQGTSNWHDYAIPSNQLTGASVGPYKGVDGAFIANFGTADQTNVKLSTTLQFTPTGGSATTVHTDSIILASFPALDSIYAMFATSLYDLPASGKGRYDITYNVSAAATDDYTGDNTTTATFYTTDSLYSKGRYDFTKNQPVSTLFEQPGFTTPSNFIWGPMYYVANGGSQIQNIQFSIAAATSGVITSLGSPVPAYVFQWQDGSNGEPMDSIVQNNELILLGAGIKLFDGVSDSSEQPLTVPVTDSDGNPSVVLTQSNSWYYIGVEVPASFYLGIDGSLDAYPRVAGRFHNAASYLEYPQVLWAGPRASGETNSMIDLGDDANGPCPFSGTSFVNAIDSVIYQNEKGIVPSVAMLVNNHPSAVKNVSAPVADVKLYPNPATNVLNVSADFTVPAKTVTYTIIDGLARFVSNETHHNVQNDKLTVNTSNLPAGTYFLSIVADNKFMSRKFTVIR